MELVPCVTCGCHLVEASPRCPHCGAVDPLSGPSEAKSLLGLGWLWTVIACGAYGKATDTADDSGHTDLHDTDPSDTDPPDTDPPDTDADAR